MGPKSYEEAGESPLELIIIASRRDEVLAVRSVQLLRLRVLHMLCEFFDGSQKM